MQVSRLIRYAMHKRGITNGRQLAVALGRSDFYAHRLLSGEGTPCKTDECRKLCAVLGIRPSVLYEAIRADNIARWERTWGDGRW